jgi:hypothetical protein
MPKSPIAINLMKTMSCENRPERASWIASAIFARQVSADYAIMAYATREPESPVFLSVSGPRAERSTALSKGYAGYGMMNFGGALPPDRPGFMRERIEDELRGFHDDSGWS